MRAGAGLEVSNLSITSEKARARDLIFPIRVAARRNHRRDVARRPSAAESITLLQALEVMPVHATGGAVVTLCKGCSVWRWARSWPAPTRGRRSLTTTSREAGHRTGGVAGA